MDVLREGKWSLECVCVCVNQISMGKKIKWRGGEREKESKRRGGGTKGGKTIPIL